VSAKLHAAEGRLRARCARVALACSVALAGSVAPAAELRAQGEEPVPVETRRLRGSAALLVGRGGNVGVSAGSDGIVLIDDQFAPQTPGLLAAAQSLSEEPLRFVINTHWHGDHTGGNENFGRAGAVIVAHAKVRARMSSEQFMASMNRRVPPSPAVALPIVTFSEGLSFHLNGDELRVEHVAPAHTDGDSLVKFELANVLHMGDTFFHGMYPFFDLSSGGSIEGMLAAAERGLALSDAETQIIPGHGPLATRADLQRYRDMLATLIARVRAQVAAGKSLAQTLAAQPSAEFDAANAAGFLGPADFVGLVYRSLGGTRTER